MPKKLTCLATKLELGSQIKAMCRVSPSGRNPTYRNLISHKGVWQYAPTRWVGTEHRSVLTSEHCSVLVTIDTHSHVAGVRPRAPALLADEDVRQPHNNEEIASSSGSCRTPRND